MKAYVLILIAGLLGIITSLITYAHRLPDSLQIIVILLTSAVIIGIAIYQRRKDSVDDKKVADTIVLNHLVSEMRDFARYLTNGSEEEKTLEAKILSKHYASHDKDILYKAIAQVLSVPLDKVPTMISDKPNEWQFVDGLIRNRLSIR